MEFAKRARTARRMVRRERWIGLWLMRLVAFLGMFEDAIAGNVLHPCINRFLLALSDTVVNMITLRATWSPGVQRRRALRRAFGCALAQKGAYRKQATPRALLGGALRRALKAKTLKGRAEALQTVLRARDVWVGYMARRLARGQTRIYSLHTRVAENFLLHQPSLKLGWSLSPSKLGEELRVGPAPP